MFTVALIGPDGAGKTTVGLRLQATLPMPVKYLYMGVNLDASNHMLPTTRAIHLLRRARSHTRWAKPSQAGPPGPPGPLSRGPRPSSRLKRAALGLKSSLRLTNRLAEEWFRQSLAWYYQRRGYIIVFDRHFFSDYYAYDIAGNGRGRSLARRIHGFMLSRIYPRPDLVIYLDAPAEVLFARKGEGTLESLERRRGEYLQLRNLFPTFVVVDASQPEPIVTAVVAELIQDYYLRRTSGGGELHDAHG